jgi:chaperonin cofactor prefoldin
MADAALKKIILDFRAVQRRLDDYIAQLPDTEKYEEETSTLEDALTEIDNALDEMEAIGD